MDVNGNLPHSISYLQGIPQYQDYQDILRLNDEISMTCN
jgi:hypothetical protein